MEEIVEANNVAKPQKTIEKNADEIQDFLDKEIKQEEYRQTVLDEVERSSFNPEEGRSHILDRQRHEAENIRRLQEALIKAGIPIMPKQEEKINESDSRASDVASKSQDDGMER